MIEEMNDNLESLETIFHLTQQEIRFLRIRYVY